VELLSELLVCWPMLMLLVQERGLLGQVLQGWGPRQELLALLVQERGLLGQVLQGWEPRQELLALLVLLAWWAAALVLAWLAWPPWPRASELAAWGPAASWAVSRW
jgi:hypothetical protein